MSRSPGESSLGKPTKRGFMKSFRAITASAVGVLAFGGLAYAAASPAQAAPVHHYAKAFNYQFDSDGPATGNVNVYADAPQHDSSDSQTLGANGVHLSDPAGASGDSGVVVPLGRLDSLFGPGNTYRPLNVVGSGLEGSYNLYIDTSGNGTYFGWSAPGPYADSGGNLQGDTKFSVPFGSSSTAILGGYANEGLLGGAFATGTSYTLQQVEAAYHNHDATDPDPLVWAWIGTGDSSSDENGYVTSVDGRDLVSATVTAPAPVSEISSFTDYSASCLTADALANSPVQLWTCGVRSQDQNFGFATFGGNQVLESAHHNLCVTAPAGAGQLRLDPCTGDASQVVLKHGPYYVFTGDSGYVMDDAAWNTADGAQVIAYPANGGRNQKFSLP